MGLSNSKTAAAASASSTTATKSIKKSHKYSHPSSPSRNKGKKEKSSRSKQRQRHPQYTHGKENTIEEEEEEEKSSSLQQTYHSSMSYNHNSKEKHTRYTTKTDQVPLLFPKRVQKSLSAPPTRIIMSPKEMRGFVNEIPQSSYSSDTKSSLGKTKSFTDAIHNRGTKESRNNSKHNTRPLLSRSDLKYIKLSREKSKPRANTISKHQTPHDVNHLHQNDSGNDESEDGDDNELFDGSTVPIVSITNTAEYRAKLSQLKHFRKLIQHVEQHIETLQSQHQYYGVEIEHIYTQEIQPVILCTNKQGGEHNNNDDGRNSMRRDKEKRISNKDVWITITILKFLCTVIDTQQCNHKDMDQKVHSDVDINKRYLECARLLDMIHFQKWLGQCKKMYKSVKSLYNGEKILLSCWRQEFNKKTRNDQMRALESQVEQSLKIIQNIFSILEWLCAVIVFERFLIQFLKRHVSTCVSIYNTHRQYTTTTTLPPLRDTQCDKESDSHTMMFCVDDDKKDIDKNDGIGVDGGDNYNNDEKNNNEEEEEEEEDHVPCFAFDRKRESYPIDDSNDQAHSPYNISEEFIFLLHAYEYAQYPKEYLSRSTPLYQYRRNKSEIQDTKNPIFHGDEEKHTTNSIGSKFKCDEKKSHSTQMIHSINTVTDGNHSERRDTFEMIKCEILNLLKHTERIWRDPQLLMRHSSVVNILNGTYHHHHHHNKRKRKSKENHHKLSDAGERQSLSEQSLVHDTVLYTTQSNKTRYQRSYSESNNNLNHHHHHHYYSKKNESPLNQGNSTDKNISQSSPSKWYTRDFQGQTISKTADKTKKNMDLSVKRRLKLLKTMHHRMDHRLNQCAL